MIRLISGFLMVLVVVLGAAFSIALLVGAVLAII